MISLQMKDERLEKMRRKKSECLEEKRECSGNLQAERLAGEKQKVWQENLKETPSGNKPERRERKRDRERWREGGEREGKREELHCSWTTIQNLTSRVLSWLAGKQLLSICQGNVLCGVKASAILLGESKLS